MSSIALSGLESESLELFSTLTIDSEVDENTWFSQLDQGHLAEKGLSRQGIHRVLPLARRRGLVRLLNAVLQEGLWTCSLAASDKTVGEGLVPLWQSRMLLVMHCKRVASLRLYTAVDQIKLVAKDRVSRYLTSPADLLMLLAREWPHLDEHSFRRFNRELVNSYLNDALYLAYAELWREEIRREVTLQSPTLFWSWLCQLQGRVADPQLLLEQWSTSGHPVHPIVKAKLGMESAQVLATAPEFRGKSSLHLAAIRRDCVHVEAMPGENGFTLFAERYPEWFDQWCELLGACGLAPEDYLPLPIHGCHLSNILACCGALLSNRELVLMEDAVFTVTPTMSFRTVVARDLYGSLHMKLPISIRLTSVTRTISPRSCEMGPRISALLTQLCRDDRLLGKDMVFVPEKVGIHFVGKDAVSRQWEKWLNVIYRENPSNCVDDGDIVLPVASLVKDSPVDPRPLFVEIAALNYGEDLAAVLASFRDYLSIAVSGPMRLYFKYGIALEAHQQNSLLVYSRTGVLKTLLVRDFGGIRIHEPCLRKQGYEIQWHEDRLTQAKSRAEARHKLLHTLFVCHLGGLIASLSEYFAVDDAVFWREVAIRVSKLLQAHQSIMTDAHWQQDNKAFLHAPWKTKAFVAMRLQDSNSDLFVTMDNPLPAHLSSIKNTERRAHGKA